MAVDALTEIGYFDEQATNVFSVVSSATPTVNVDQFGVLEITALAADITVVTPSSASGNGPVNFQKLIVRIKDNGAGTHTGVYDITWGALFENVGATAPVTTVASKRHTVTFLYSTLTSKWGCVSAVVEA